MTASVRFETSLRRLVTHGDRDVRLYATRCVGRLPGAAMIAKLRELALDLDPMVRREALATLSERAPMAGRATLRAAFDDDLDVDCRRAALAGLAKLGDSAALPALRRVVRNPDAFVYETAPALRAAREQLCCEAVEALASIGDASVVADLEALLDRHIAPKLDDAVIRTLAHLGERGCAVIATLVQAATLHRAGSAVAALADCPDAGQTEALTLFLSHEDESVRLKAARHLAELAPSHSALLRRAQDPSPAVRAIVAEHAGPTMPAVLEDLLDDDEPEVVGAALKALRRLPPSHHAPELIWSARRRLRSNDVDVACRAAEALAALDADAARGDLADRLRDPLAPVALRLTAVRLLVADRGAAVIPLLASVLMSTEARLRRGILDALVGLAGHRRGGDEAASVLAELLTGGSRRGPAAFRHRYGSAPALAEAAVPFDAPPPWLGAAPAEMLAKVRVEIALRLGDIPHAGIARALTVALEATDDAPLRTAAAASLARLVERTGDAPGEVLVVARELASEACPELRLAGLSMLAATRDPGHAEALAAALDDPEPKIRVRAATWIGETSLPLASELIDRLAARLDDSDLDVRVAAMIALLRRRGEPAIAVVIDTALTSGEDALPAVAQGLRRLEPDVVHIELAKRLARAYSRDRQLALLRLSDAVLAAGAAA